VLGVGGDWGLVLVCWFVGLELENLQFGRRFILKVGLDFGTAGACVGVEGPSVRPLKDCSEEHQRAGYQEPAVRPEIYFHDFI